MEVESRKERLSDWTHYLPSKTKAASVFIGRHIMVGTQESDESEENGGRVAEM